MDIALSLLALAIVALVLGAVALFRRGGYRKQAILMLVLAGVMAMNLAIAVVPTTGGDTLADAARKAPE